MKAELQFLVLACAIGMLAPSGAGKQSHFVHIIESNQQMWERLTWRDLRLALLCAEAVPQPHVCLGDWRR